MDTSSVNGMSHNSPDSVDSDLAILLNLQTLVPKMKQEHIAMCQQFTQFLDYAQQFDRLAATIRSLQSKLSVYERELEQLRNDDRVSKEQIMVHADSVVYLNVDGQLFSTTVKTLTQSASPNYFTKLLSEKWSPETNASDNRIFIDRDGRLFDYVLKYLRTGEVHIEDKIIRKELITEAKYYKLPELEKKLTSTMGSTGAVPGYVTHETANQLSLTKPGSTASFSKSPVLSAPFTSGAKSHPAQTSSFWRASPLNDDRLCVFHTSQVLTLDYEEKLLDFIGGDRSQPWRLIYRATEHGFNARDFHDHCDSLSPTLSIIQTDFGNVFGGYTTVPWSSAMQRTDRADPEAFLFTLRNNVGVPPTKFPVATQFQHCAITHNPTCGPNFGSPNNEGSDLCLRNQFNEKGNCVFFPKSYVDTSNQGALVFARRYFACKEVEVFTLDVNSQNN